MRCLSQWMIVGMTAGALALVGCGAQTETAVDDDLSPPVVETTPASTDSAAPAEAPASEAPAAETSPATETPAEGAPAAAPGEAAAPAAGEPSAESSSLAPVPVANGVAELSPANTKIQFVGIHSGDKPDPRTGGFAKFSGQAKVNAEANSLESVTVEIDTTSLFTPIQKLTDHLKSPDFFEVREYPTAKFESTKIAAGVDGQATITGNLTLHGVTKEISFPATVSVADDGLTLQSEFTIDRAEFGMDYGVDKVERLVQMTVVVGEATRPE